MMECEQQYLIIKKDELVTEVIRRKLDGWYLSQISATFSDVYDILYTLEKDYDIINLRLRLDKNETVDSISAVFPYSYLYENEMKDLFGIDVHGMNIDFNGTLYKTAIKAPFRETVSKKELKGNG